MSKNTKNIGTQRHQTPFRAPATATDAKGKIMTLLKQKGFSLSESDLLRIVTKPCFTPHHEHERAFYIQGPMQKNKLKHFLTPRFGAWVRPLIKNGDAIVDLDELSNGTWVLWVWVTHEYLFRWVVKEWEQAARNEEKIKTGKIPSTTMSLYLTREERLSLGQRAKRFDLKRARNDGESRMLRLVATHMLPDFLEYLESSAFQAREPAPKGGKPQTHLTYGQA